VANTPSYPRVFIPPASVVVPVPVNSIPPAKVEVAVVVVAKIDPTYKGSEEVAISEEVAVAPLVMIALGEVEENPVPPCVVVKVATARAVCPHNNIMHKKIALNISNSKISSR
jgi:hypothetical protein